MIAVGCAGWSLPRQEQRRFAQGESHLQRYASRFAVTEINSTFHRPHRAHIYECWANAVPADCAKLPKIITHEQRLVNGEALLSLAFDCVVAAGFLEMLRKHWQAKAAMEPRDMRAGSRPTRTS